MTLRTKEGFAGRTQIAQIILRCQTAPLPVGLAICPNMPNNVILPPLVPQCVWRRLNGKDSYQPRRGGWNAGSCRPTREAGAEARACGATLGEVGSVSAGTALAGVVPGRGWIKARWGTSENNRRAKFYALTRAGRRQLEIERHA